MRKAAGVTLLLLGLLVLNQMSVFAAELQYPYHATPERERAILDGYVKVKSGMNVTEVKKILGEPDEVRDLYEPNIKSGKTIGFTYWYLIQRLKVSGSQAEKNEKLVRVSFGLDGKAIKVERW